MTSSLPVSPDVASPFQGLVGQPEAIALLTQAVARQRIAPAYLFAGPPGIGKRLAAERFAEVMLGHGQSTHHRVTSPERLAVLRQRVQQRNHPDLFWVEPTYLHQGKRVTVSEAIELGVKRRSPPQIRLEQIREITQFLSRPALESERAIVVVDDAETMAEPAANALLKTLEEPGRATIILIAPGIDSLLPTLVSRCQRIPFRRLSQADMAQVLGRGAHADLAQRDDLLAIAQGSPGEAIASWERLQAIPPELITAAAQPITSLRSALELARQIAKTLDTDDQIWLLQYLQNHAWQQQPHPQRILILEQARKHLRRYVQPRLVWETALMALLGDDSRSSGFRR